MQRKEGKKRTIELIVGDMKREKRTSMLELC
jgi:hypothetical protein